MKWYVYGWKDDWLIARFVHSHMELGPLLQLKRKQGWSMFWRKVA